MAILALADDKMQRRASESLSTDRATFDMHSASEWPADSLGASNGVSEGADLEVIMITPPQCRMIWRQCQSDTGYIVQQVHLNALGDMGNARLALASHRCFARSICEEVSPSAVDGHVSQSRWRQCQSDTGDFVHQEGHRVW